MANGVGLMADSWTLNEYVDGRAAISVLCKMSADA
jgi:hypothetical protein